MFELRDIVNRCLRGDQLAMIQLVDHYRGQVFGLCYRMLGHRQDAEDVTQETFVRVLKNLHRWDSQRAFEPWLLAIAGNRCRTALAMRMRRPSTQTLDHQVADDTQQRWLARNLEEEVQLLLEQLRSEYREAFVLFHEHQLSYAEIAESMDCPLGTVKTWVHRARQELVRLLRRREEVAESDATLRRL